MIDFHRIAETVRQRADHLPLGLTVREMRSYDVGFSSVEILVEQRLAAVDRAVLSLVAALGSASIDDVRGYLGLGADVSALTTRRLLGEGLLRETAGRAPPQPTAARHVEVRPPPLARTLMLSPLGTDSLAAGTRVSVHAAPLRLVLWDDPLWFIEAPKPSKPVGRDLHPKETPDSMRTLESALSRPAAERLKNLGLPEIIPGQKGRLARLTPGATYEVRHAKSYANLLVGATAPDAEHPIAFVGNPKHLDRAPDLDGRVVSVGVAEAKDTFEAVECSVLPTARGLTSAILVAAPAHRLVQMLGLANAPREEWLPVRPGAAIRYRAVPADDEGRLAALVLFLARQLVALRRDLDGAIADCWTTLARFWGEEDQPMPSRSEIVAALWADPAARGPLCAARLRRDLVEPFLETR